MKKKMIIIVIIGVLVISIIFGISIFCYFASTIGKISTNNRSQNTFDVKDYSLFIENFQDCISIGEIENSKMAKDKGLLFLKEKFGEKVGAYEPYNVYFDKKNNCWLLRGTLDRQISNSIKGGTPCVIFDNNGNVLALWHGK